MISIIVKTFKRPDCLKTFIDSVRKYYPDIKIYVADDSDESFIGEPTKIRSEKNIFYWKMPFNSGLSSGRNFLVSKVLSKYVLLCDDDFIFCDETKLEYLQDKIESDVADIIGGKVGGQNSVEYNYTFQKIESTLHYIKKHKYIKDDLYFYDIIPNFFIAKTSVLKKIRWDNKLKMVEHSDFFLRCLNAGIRVAFTDKVRILHEHKNDNEYKQYRNSVTKYKDLFMQKHSILDVTKTRSEFNEFTERNFNCKNFKNAALMNLRDLSFIFNRLNKKHWISNGTLLGICRAGDLIKHDTDTDMMIPIEDLDFQMIKEMKIQGFKILRLYGTIENGLELSTARNGVKADIFFAYPHGKDHFTVSVWKNGNQIKNKYSNVKIKKMMWENIEINIPSDPSRFLCQSYGPGWRIPDTEKKWNWAFSPENVVIDPFETVEEFKNYIEGLPANRDNEKKNEIESLKYLAEKLGNNEDMEFVLNLLKKKDPETQKDLVEIDLSDYDKTVDKMQDYLGCVKSYVLNMPDQKERLLYFSEYQKTTGLVSKIIRPVTISGTETPKRKAELSHQNTIANILGNETADKIIIFEDDIVFEKDFDSTLQIVLKELPEDFAICYLGCYIRREFKLRRYSDHLIEFIEPTHKIWGSHGIIYNRPVYKKLSKSLKNPDSMVTDFEIAKNLVGKERCFFVDPMIVHQNYNLKGTMEHHLDFKRMKEENQGFIERNLNL